MLWPMCIFHASTDHWMCSMKAGTIMESAQCIICHQAGCCQWISATTQLWTSCSRLFENTEPDYGIDYEASEAYVNVDSSPDVVIPPTRIQLPSEDQELLHIRVNPLAASTNYGIELYEEAVRMLHEFHNPSNNSP